MNAQPPNTQLLNVIETKELVSENISDFVKQCLESDFEKIVPIEGEGLAILLPFLSDYPDRAADIIPSNSLRFIDDKELQGKRVLVLDVSVSTGKTLFKVAKVVEKKTRVKPALAALFVRSEFEHREKLFYRNYLSLLPNAYSWAKEVIVGFLLNEVFVHPTDPPLWEISFPEHHRGALIKALLQFSGSYSLPPAEVSDSWIRITIDKIALRHSNWLGGSIANDANNKVRVIIHRDKNIMRILPLFFPLISDEKRLPISQLIEGAAQRLPSEFDAVIGHAQKVESQNPYVAYNWVSSVGSMLLFKDFAVLLKKLFQEFKVDEIRLAAPVPSIYQYSCHVTILKSFENVAKKIIQDSSMVSEQDQFDPTFLFSSDDPALIAKAFEMPEKLKYLSPEEFLMHVLGEKIKEQEESNNGEEMVFSLAQIERIASTISTWAISCALDRLVDEGVLKPRVGEISPGYVGRVYASPGETVKNRLMNYGLIARMAKLASLL